jgi:predicted ATPase/DNA-binding CsgD family transcriptional regulator/transcriptional regulator with XRE-family HTH domain
MLSRAGLYLRHLQDEPIRRAERAMDDQEAFGRLLRRLRTAHTLTQAALAQQASCAIDTIKKIEAGVRRPSRQLAAQFANCLGLAGDERAAFLGAARAVGGAAEPGASGRLTIMVDTAGPPTPSYHSNLPHQVTSFIGRAREIALAKSLLQTTPSRLLTLTGAGGCGKTRLALEVAGDLVDDYPDGVWVVELAGLFDPLLVPQAVAAVLQIRADPRPSASEQLLDALRSKALLLVLDNCEHLLAACAALADTVVRTCPKIQILATSREALGIADETVYLVPSLTQPDASVGSALAPEDLSRIGLTEAVRLFVERAQAVWPSFALTAQNAGAVAQICRRLDGIPLALELAAARVKLLRVEEIAAYLDNCFRLLTVGSRGAAERHQTLQAAIDWSYDLLMEAERVLLRRLAVFAGGFTIEAAQAVCADVKLPPDALFDGLARLVDKSLVIVSHDYHPTRYRLLEPIRQYARDKLLAAGEAEAIQRCHADFFVSLVEQPEPQLCGVEDAIWLVRLQQEHDNLRAAVQWAVQQNDAALVARLARALYWFWFLAGAVSEGRRSVAGILAVAGAAGDPAARARELNVAGYLAFLDADYGAARAPLEESATICRRIGDQHGLAHSLNVLGRVVLFQGDAAAAYTLLRESATLFREVGDHSGRAFALLGLTMVAIDQGDYAEAHSRAEEVLSIYQGAGNQWGVAIALNYLGDVARCQADYRRAEGLYTRSQMLFHDAGVEAETAPVLHNLGYVSLAQGDHARAQALFAESLARQRARGNRAGILEGLAGLGALRAAQGQPRRAAVLFGAIAALRAAFGTPMWPTERIEHERHRTKVRTALGAGVWQAALAEGQGMPLEHAIAYALERAETDRPAQPQDARMAGDGLTAREREVVVLIAQGKSNREIAAALVVTERTVETHIRNIRSKLDVTSRAQLAVWAVDHGLLTGRT